MSTHHRITAGIVALGLAASAAPASAFPTNINANGSEVPAIPTSTHAQATHVSRPVGTPAAIVRVNAPNGFDWGDAAIGAAGGVALTMIGVGGGLAASGRRSRRAHGTPAVTS